MSVASIVIDNFLDSSQWSTIQDGMSDFLNSSEYSENRNSLNTQIHEWIETKL